MQVMQLKIGRRTKTPRSLDRLMHPAEPPTEHAGDDAGVQLWRTSSVADQRLAWACPHSLGLAVRRRCPHAGAARRANLSIQVRPNLLCALL